MSSFQRKPTPNELDEIETLIGETSSQSSSRFHLLLDRLKRLFSRYKSVRKRSVILFLLFVAICVYMIVTTVLYLVLTNHMSNMDQLDMKSCPACYGQSACPYFIRGEIHLDGVYRYPVTHILNAKNVYTASMGYFKNERIYVKKMAPDQQLADVDKSLCYIAGVRESEPCVPRVAIHHEMGFDGNTKLTRRHIAKLSNLTYCATDRLIDRIKSKFREKNNPRSDFYLRFDDLVLLYNMRVNSHALVLQTFSPDEGWPFSKFIGACGRYIVEKYAGEPLHTFFTQPLHIRLKLARELLNLANRLSENEDAYMLVLGDLNERDFVVTKKHRITLVDTGEILVVDTHTLKNMQFQGAEVPHSMPYYCPLDTSECMSSVQEMEKLQRPSSDMLCSHTKADYNYFAMCRFLHSGVSIVDTEATVGATTATGHPISLLSNIPKSLEEKYHIGALLNRCFLGVPSKKNNNIKLDEIGNVPPEKIYQIRKGYVHDLLELLPLVARTLDDQDEN